MDALTDPATLRGDDDVEFVDTDPVENEDHFEVYDGVAGRAVVGVTDADGRLLVMEHPELPVPGLNTTVVEHGQDYVAAARDGVALGTGLDVAVDGVRRVRRQRPRHPDGRETEAYEVVFAATPTGDGEIDPDAGHDWTAAWRDPAAVELPDEADNEVLSDLRLFLPA